MESAEIRRRFLAFFEERGHTVVPSASLLLNDPTLLQSLAAAPKPQDSAAPTAEE